MSKHQEAILLFGGSFDPLHNGHLQAALAVQKQFQFDRFIFLPCKLPLLKSPSEATAAQRVDMLKRGLPSFFEIDEREIKRESPSYMVDTLVSFRQQLGFSVSITLLLGEDTFNQLPQWHEWERLLTLANLLVIKRPGVLPLPSSNIKKLSDHNTEDANQILSSPFGCIYAFNAGEYDIASTSIREKLKQQEPVDHLLPPAVYDYIQEQKLYGKLSRDR